MTIYFLAEQITGIWI